MLPHPTPGLVIRYAYLWRDEAQRGREEGLKDRPCAVVLALRREGSDVLTVAVAPITHAPRPAGAGVEVPVPAATARRLGLDDERSWIVTTEANLFAWQGPDLGLADLQRKETGIVLGRLPAGLSRAVIAEILRNRHAGRLARVGRTGQLPRG